MITGLYAIDIVNEMNHCVSSRLGWTTTTFRQSTPSLVEELLISRVQLTKRILTSASFENVRVQVAKQLNADPGMGDGAARAALNELMPTSADDFKEDSDKYHGLTARVAEMKSEYLHNWQAEFTKSIYAATSAISQEEIIPASGAAAFITAFLLDSGLSSEYIVKWVDYRLSPNSPDLTLDTFMQQLIRQYETGRGSSEIMVVVDQSAVPIARAVEGWLSRAKVDLWFLRNDFTAPQGIHGGILYISTQWDIYGALQDVSDSLRRISYRASLKFGKAPSFHRLAWIKGVQGPRRIPSFTWIETRMPAYQMEAPSLVLPTSDNRLEVAVQFLQSASATGGATAAGMLWVALETLLFASGESKMTVVDRAADIGLVAFIRSELQNSIGLIAGRCKGDPIGQAMAGLPRQDRPRYLEALLKSREYESITILPARIHLAHAARLLDIEYLDEMRQTFHQCLADLYRQRNLVLHGGITDGPLIGGTLRCCFPLVAAIVNRYARVSEKSSMNPQAAALQAHESIETHKLSTSPSVLDFLQ